MPTHLLTPRMAGILDRMRRANRPSYHQLSPQQARLAYRMGAEIMDLPRAPVARVEELRIPGPASELLARLYLHGGSFTIGGMRNA